MTRRWHTRKTLAGVLLLLGSACTGIISSPDGDGDPERGGPGGRGGAAGAAGADGGLGDGLHPQTDPNASVVCAEGEETPGPRLLRLLTRGEYARTAADVLGIAKPEVDNLPVEPVVAGFDNNASAAVVTSRHIDEYITTGEKLARQALTQSRAKLVTCDATKAGCDRTFVETFGKRAFRRPLSAEETTRYIAMFAPALSPTFDEGVVLVVSSMFASPSFLYRIEAGDPVGDGTFKLSPFEVASALSYTFWGTSPDDTLLAAATAGTLSTPAAIEKEARRLLADPRSRTQVAAFFTQWLRTSATLEANKDKAVYPNFTDQVRTSLAAEQAAFVNHVVFDGTKSFGELFTADYVFANDTLAKYYGLAAPGSQEPKKVPVGATPTRGGVLTLGSVLASHAHSNESSPIKRGVFVRDRILCQELPPPPASVNTTPPGLDPKLTTRDRFSKHNADPACRGCHQFIDGVGFGFERYDGVGAYRTMENGLAVDATGEITNREALDVVSKETFDGPRALGALLATSERAQSCMATQYYRYARGFKEGKSDVCAVRSLGVDFKKGELNIQELLVHVATQKSFSVRRDGGDSK